MFIIYVFPYTNNVVRHFRKGFGVNLVRRVRRAGTELINKVPRVSLSASLPLNTLDERVPLRGRVHVW